MPQEETGDTAVLDDLDKLEVSEADLAEPGDDSEPSQVETTTSPETEATEVESGATSAGSTTTPAAPTQAEVTASRFAPVQEILSKAGYRFTGQDDASIEAELNQLFGVQLPALRQYAQVGQQFYPHREKLQQYLQEQQGGEPVQQATPVRPQSPGLLPALPEYESAWEGMLTYDEQGNVTGTKPGAQLDLPPKVAAYQQARQARAEMLLTNPEGVIQSYAEPLIEQRVNELLDQRFAAMQQQNFVERAVNDNQDWMFVLDSQGNKTYSPLDGSPILKPEGMAYGRRVEYLQSVGVSDPQAQHFLALEHIGKLPGTNGKPNAPAQAAVDPEIARKQSLIEQQKKIAANKAGRGGSARNSLAGKLPPAQNDKLSLDQMLKASLDDIPDEAFKAN